MSTTAGYNRPGQVSQGQGRVRLPGVGRDVENVLLWRDVRVSAIAFVGLTLLYILLEWSGLTLLTIFSNTLLALISIAFIWNNVSKFTGRPGVPLPDFVRTGVNESQLKSLAESFTSIINRGLGFLDRLISGKDVILTVEVAAGLYVFGKIGNYFSSLGLLYTLVVLAFSIPKIYELKKDDIDNAVSTAQTHGVSSYKNYVEPYVNKIPRASTSSSTTSSYNPNPSGSTVSPTSGQNTGSGAGNLGGGSGGGNFSNQGGTGLGGSGGGGSYQGGGGGGNYQGSGGGSGGNYQGSGGGSGGNYQGSGGGTGGSYQGGGGGAGGSFPSSGTGTGGGNYSNQGATGAGGFDNYPNQGTTGGNVANTAGGTGNNQYNPNQGTGGGYPGSNTRGGFESEVDQYTNVGRDAVAGVNPEGKKLT